MNSLDLKTATSPVRTEPAMSTSAAGRGRFTRMLSQLDDVYAELDSRD